MNDEPYAHRGLMTESERLAAAMFEGLGKGELLPVDNVHRPAHYTQGGIECIDAIQAALTPDEFRGFCKGNALKYTWRERHKGGDESLQKAQWYLARMVAP